jgi:uncharacterized protein YndB with AHSA1/START domain
MARTIVPAPVRTSIRVDTHPARAFDVFAASMGQWWLPSNSINASPLKDVVIEPRVGGRWYERGEDGSECDWGRVLAWEPPARLVLAWQIDGQWRFNPDLVTEVEVRFIPDGEHATRVELEHRNIERFGNQADAIRAAFDSPKGWSGLLERFAAATA